MQRVGVALRGMAAAICAAALVSVAVGQVRPIAGELPLSSAAAKADVAPVGQEAFEIPFVLDPNPSGGDFLHIVRDHPGATISVRTPAGTVLSSSTAVTHGYTWQEANVQANSIAQDDDSDGFGPDLSTEGTHTILLFPQNQPAGTYVIVVDTRGFAEPTSLQMSAYLDSPIAATVSSDASTYRLGESVTVAAVIFENEQPIVNAAATATIVAYRYVTGDATAGGLSLESKTDLGNGLSRYEYKALLTNNTGNSQWRFVATADTLDENVRIIRGSLGFDPISGGMPVQSEETILVLAPTSPNFDPSTLDWEVTAYSAPVELSLGDAGPGNELTADGVFSTRFVPTETGLYEIGVKIQGTSPSGKPFYRVASSGFSVISAQATVASITAEGIDVNHNEKYEAIRFNASITVQESGGYSLSFQIMDSADRTYTIVRAASLSAGAEEIVMDADAKHLLVAGFTTGPFSINEVTLRREVFDRDTVVDYHATMGVTPAYDLGDFERGSIYFTGQATEQALNLDGQAGYDVLRVQAEVAQGPGVSARTMNCRVQGTLTDAAGFVVDAVTGEAGVSEGSNWVTIDFRGPKIARSNVNGPYAARDFSIECSGMRDSRAALLTTTGYLAADFQNMASDFVIDKSAIDVMAGETRTIPIPVRGMGAYEGAVVLSVLSTSPGLTASVDYPELRVDSLTTVKLSAAAGIAPGNYAMALSATDGMLTRTKTVPVVVNAVGVYVEVAVTGSTFLLPGMSTQLTATVTNATNPAVTWAVSPSVGTVSASGLYTAPGSIATEQTVTVTATSVADGTKSASAVVTLMPAVAVSVSPTTALLRANQTQQFTATVTNATNTGVTWTVDPSMGTVNASGLYTAPSPIASQQTVTVTATSVEDGTKAASAVVTLRPPVAVSVSPTTASLSGGQTRQFTATVTNATNTGVTWTRSPGVGSVSASGLYTAPSPIATQQTVTVTATSVEDSSKAASATVTLLPPVNAKPSIQGATPSNGAGWATVFKYVFSDSNGAEDIATAEVSYSTGSGAPFANSCWFVYSKSTNAVRLYNNAGTGFVSGQIVADTSGGNLSNSRCSLVGGSLKAYPAGNTLTLFLGIGFTTGTARNYTARLKAVDTAGAVAGFSPYGTWTVPVFTTPPSSPAASGSGSPSAPLTVSLVDVNNASLYDVDIDDIQTLVTKTGGGADSCRFFYFAPAEMIVLMDDDDVHWAGVSKAGGGGGAISNSKCMVNAAAAQKTYDSNTKRFGITVPVTAHGAFTGTKYVYVGGSDLSGNIASPSWVHSWTTN